MLHLRVVSPPDVTGTVVSMLRSEPAVANLTVLPGTVSHPDGDAVHFDVLHGAANDVIGRLRGLGLDRPVWPEVQARVALEGAYPPSWFILLTIAGLTARAANNPAKPPPTITTRRVSNSSDMVHPDLSMSRYGFTR